MLHRRTFLAALALAGLSIPAQAALASPSPSVNEDQMARTVTASVRSGPTVVSVPDIAFTSEELDDLDVEAVAAPPPAASASRNDTRIDLGSQAVADTAGPTVPDGTSTVGGQIVAAAASQAGIPYVYGGSSPTEGFDCSGLVQWSYAQVGITLPRVAAEQGHSGVITGSPVPGDIVFWPDFHVGIYVSPGRMIDSSTPGSVVSEHDIWGSPLYVHIPAQGES